MADNTIIKDGLNISQIFSLYGNISFRPAGANVGGSCNKLAKSQEVIPYVTINFPFNVWHATSKHILDQVEGSIGTGGAPSEYLSTFASFFFGANKLTKPAMSGIWNGIGNLIPAIVPTITILPIFDFVDNQIFNSRIAPTTTYNYTAKFDPSIAPACGTTTCDITIIDLSTGTANATNTFDVGFNGIANISITTGNISAPGYFSYNINFPIYNIANYPNSIVQTINFANIISPIFVPTIVGG